MPDETFVCNKYHCLLTRQACADRQAARTLTSYGKKPTYPGCQDCVQGATETKGIISDVKPTLWGRNYNHQNTQEDSMQSKRKRDTCSNCKRPNMACMGAVPLCGSCQLAITGVSDPEERKRLLAIAAERLSGKGKLRLCRKTVDNPEDTKAPVRQPRPSQLAPSRGPVGDGLGGGMPAQIIPVTLRLTVEVNVRVSAAGA